MTEFERQTVYVVFGEYCPEPYVEGVYNSREKAEEAIAELSKPEQYTIASHWVY